MTSAAEPTRSDDETARIVEARRVSFGSVAEVYDRVRPDWPIETLTWLMGSPDVPVDVLEVGAGTGKATRPLVAAGHRVIATEPSDGMLSVLRASLERDGLDERRAQTVQTVQARAEDLPLADGSVDAVVSLQAWHWVDPVAAGREAARVLRPDGVLGLAWHNMDLGIDWVDELNHVTHGDEIFTRDKDVHMDPHAEGFAPFERAVFDYVKELDVDELVLLADSWSFVQVAPDRDEVLKQVRVLGERVADTHGRIHLPYRTGAARAHRA